MKNAAAPKKPRASEDKMSQEYRFDYAKAKPNRFAGKMEQGSIAIVLDPDVAAVFGTSELVNTLLRSVISSFKPKRKK